MRPDNFKSDHNETGQWSKRWKLYRTMTKAIRPDRLTRNAKKASAKIYSITSQEVTTTTTVSTMSSSWTRLRKLVFRKQNSRDQNRQANKMAMVSLSWASEDNKCNSENMASNLLSWLPVYIDWLFERQSKQQKRQFHKEQRGNQKRDWAFYRRGHFYERHGA